MSKIKNASIILLISFYFFILINNPVSANINLTFQSDNEKVIKIINIDNNYTALSSVTNTTNQSINLTYNNYLIKLYASNTDLSEGNKGKTILNNTQAVVDDRYSVLWIVITLALVFMGIKYFTK